MRTVKRLLFFLLVFAIAIFFLHDRIFRSTVTYHSVGTRSNYSVTDTLLMGYIKRRIDDNVKDETPMNGETISRLALSATTHWLHFTDGKSDRDPNLLIHSKAANCIGYAAFCATICNAIFTKYNLSDTWIATPQIGQLYFLGINVHSYLNGPFFKDHDFVLIKNLKTGEVLAMDPSVSDYLIVDFITYRPK